MERIKLGKNAKAVLRLADHDICQRALAMNPAEYNTGALELQRGGLAVCHQEAGGNVELIQLTDFGWLYISLNPALRNPVDWAKLAAILAGISALVSILALFAACGHNPLL